MKKCLQNTSVLNKRVLLRVDYNVPIKDGKILDDSKIKATLETICYLLSENCKIIILSHLGKVKTESDKSKYSLKIVAERLKELLDKEVYFSHENFGVPVVDRVNALKGGEILMLENTRFLDVPGNLESGCDPQLSMFFASLADVFVSEAFGTAHRRHASNYGVTKYMESCIGFLMQKEIGMLNRLVIHPIHPFTVIMGGAKIDDKLELLEKLLPKCEHLLLGGGLANTCLKALGFSVGSSLSSNNYKTIKTVQDMLLKYKDKIMLPLDAIVGISYDKDYIKYKMINEIEPNEIILDIGVKTLEKYKSAINNSETIFLNGTVGMYENMRFANGTKELLNIITSSNAITVAGGGDAASSAYNFGCGYKFTYISSGGGATLEYLATETLPALDNISEEDDNIETLDL